MAWTDDEQNKICSLATDAGPIKEARCSYQSLH